MVTVHDSRSRRPHFDNNMANSPSRLCMLLVGSCVSSFVAVAVGLVVTIPLS